MLMPSFHATEPVVAFRERTFDALRFNAFGPEPWQHGKALNYLRLRLDGEPLKWFIANGGPECCRDFTICLELEGERMPVNADPREWFRVERRTHWAIAELAERDARRLAAINGTDVCWPLIQGIQKLDAAAEWLAKRA